MPCAVHRVAHGAYAAGHTRGRFIVHYAHGSDLVAAVFAEFRLHHLGIDAMPPVTGHEFDIQAKLDSPLAPQSGELADVEHQHLVAWRQRIDQRPLPSPRSGGRKDIHLSRGFEYLLESLQDFTRYTA